MFPPLSTVYRNSSVNIRKRFHGRGRGVWCLGFGSLSRVGRRGFNWLEDPTRLFVGVFLRQSITVHRANDFYSSSRSSDPAPRSFTELNFPLNFWREAPIARLNLIKAPIEISLVSVAIYIRWSIIGHRVDRDRVKQVAGKERERVSEMISF